MTYERLLAILDEALPYAAAADAQERAEREQRQQAEAAQRKAEAIRAAYEDYQRTATIWGLPNDTESARAFSESHYPNYMKED